MCGCGNTSVGPEAWEKELGHLSQTTLRCQYINGATLERGLLLRKLFMSFLTVVWSSGVGVLVLLPQGQMPLISFINMDWWA